MRLRQSSGCLVLVTGLILAGTARAQQKPFTQDQVTSMVSAGLADESGAKLIEQRGIDFKPAEDYLHQLAAAGAKDAFLAALRAATPAVTASEKPPMNQVQIFSLLVSKIATHRIAMLIEERGITFDPTDEYYQEVQVAGGDAEVVSALKTAKVIKPGKSDPAAETRQVEVRQHAARGAEFFEKGRYADAEKEYREAVRLDPNDPDLRLTLGITLTWLSDWDSAVSELREAVRLNPKDDHAHQSLGAALKEKGDLDGAVAEEREALRLNPNDPYAHCDLGGILADRGDIDGAIAEERTALRLNPNDANLHMDLGITLGKKRDWDGQVAECREAVRLDPNNAERHRDLGIALGNAGDWDGDIAEQREAVRLDPNNAERHRELGDAMEGKQDWDGDIAEQREALRLNPLNANAHRDLGIALGNKKDWDGAIAEERAALRLEPNDPERHRYLAEALGGKGDFDAEIAEVRQVLRLKPGDAAAHSEIGAALYWKNDFDGDIAEQREALRLDPTLGRPHVELGEALIRKNEWSNAAVELRVAIASDPQVANYHFGLALCLEKQGDRQGALMEYHTAYQLDPADADSKQAYERLAVVVEPAAAEHGYLGVELQDLNPDSAKQHNSPDMVGALVQSVMAGGPADQAGLAQGDIIRKINGLTVRDGGHLVTEITFLKPGATVTFEILRYGQPMVVRVALGESPLAAVPGGQEVQEGAFRGITVANITSTLRGQIGIPANVNGVVVVKIGEKSPLFSWTSRGMDEGDVIESINRHPVHDVSEFNLWASQARGRTRLQLNHHGQEISYDMNFDANQGGDR